VAFNFAVSTSSARAKLHTMDSESIKIRKKPVKKERFVPQFFIICSFMVDV
jgi:hypothetical protein